MGSSADMRSLEAIQRSPVQFINRTDRDIEIFWLNYSGEQISYGILNAVGSRLSVKPINTFVSHPWIAVDCGNGRRFWLNRKEVFHPPVPNLVRVVVGPDIEQVRVQRANIFITKPVFNAEKLVDICCSFVSKTVNLEDIDTLPLPTFVKTEIRSHYRSP